MLATRKTLSSDRAEDASRIGRLDRTDLPTDLPTFVDCASDNAFPSAHSSGISIFYTLSLNGGWTGRPLYCRHPRGGAAASGARSALTCSETAGAQCLATQLILQRRPLLPRTSQPITVIGTLLTCPLRALSVPTPLITVQFGLASAIRNQAPPAPPCGSTPHLQSPGCLGRYWSTSWRSCCR